MPFLQNGDENVHFVVDLAREKENAETIVMLHNNITDHTLFDMILPFLNDAYTIVRYDLRGLGQSERGDADLTYELYTKDLQFIIDSLQLERFHLVGIGFGALIAARYTFYHRGKVTNLILLSMACNPPHTMERIRKHRKKISHSGRQVPADYIIQMGTSLPRTHPAIMNWERILRTTHPDTYFKIMDLAISGDPIRYLDKCFIPTLILSGEKDRIFPQHFLKSSISHFPHCHHIAIPGASNFIILDKPEVTATLILDFIKDNPGQASLQKDQFVTSIYEEIRKFADPDLNLSKGTLKIDLVQGFQVSVNGKEIKDGWNKRSAKQILIYLLFHRTSTREQLCDAIWPEIPLHQAKKNLSVYLSYLKKLLNTRNVSTPILSTNREHIHLNGDISSDALDFMAHLKQASEENDPELKFALCDTLLNSLPMTFTPATYEDWFISLMRQVESRLIQLILWMSDWLIKSGKEHQAIHHLRTYLNLFNEDEQIYDKMMEQFGKQ